MPKSPLERARAFLFELARDDMRYGVGSWYVVFGGSIVLSDQSQERLAEVIAEAQEEVREGFMRKPSRKEPYWDE